MLTIIVVGLFVVITSVFPVMFVAKKLGAEKANLIDCIFAIIVGSVVVPFLPGRSTSQLMYFLYSFLVVGVVYKYMLQANYIASVLISLISTFITSVVMYVVAKIFT